jgi:hypothetical protein
VVWQGNCFTGIESEHYAIRRFCFGREVSDIAIVLSNDSTRSVRRLRLRCVLGMLSSLGVKVPRPT